MSGLGTGLGQSGEGKVVLGVVAWTGTREGSFGDMEACRGPSMKEAAGILVPYFAG